MIPKNFMLYIATLGMLIGIFYLFFVSLEPRVASPDENVARQTPETIAPNDVVEDSERPIEYDAIDFDSAEIEDVALVSPEPQTNSILPPDFEDQILAYIAQHSIELIAVDPPNCTDHECEIVFYVPEQMADEHIEAYAAFAGDMLVSFLPHIQQGSYGHQTISPGITRFIMRISNQRPTFPPEEPVESSVESDSSKK